MKPVIACILFALLGQAVSVPAFALVDTSYAQGMPQTGSVKKYWKHLKKEQKKALKSQRKAAKNWKKGHHTPQ